ncbi:leucine-rich repeat-containing protein 15-like [Chironomus tepperi]|uniref:leucine-rich repeat-containing protein 15-like n=1 Tax=Chironomus tepperi TaxID=113505 RepID=UPI00391F0614
MPLFGIHKGKGVQVLQEQHGLGRHNIQYFPRGIDKFFKNIKLIDINKGHIKEIHQADLKVFPKLESLDLCANDIQVIEAGTFDFNINLKVIWLSSKIVHIESNVFTNLSSLSYLYLRLNPCIDKNAANSLTDVKALAQEAYTMCKDSTYTRLNYQLNNLESELSSRTFLRHFSQRLNNLTNEIKGSTFSNLTSFERRIKAANLKFQNEDSLVIKVSELSGDITAMSKNTQSNLDHMKIEIADVNRRIDSLKMMISTLIGDVQKMAEVNDRSVPKTTTTTERSSFLQSQMTNSSIMNSLTITTFLVK